MNEDPQRTAGGAPAASGGNAGPQQGTGGPQQSAVVTQPAAQPNAGGATTGPSLFLNRANDLLDKLTDVLNFGRILSIGLPGFVATFGLLMLLSLFSAPMPTRWAITSGTTSDTTDIAPPTVTATEAMMAEVVKATEAIKATETVIADETAMAAEAVKAAGAVKATGAAKAIDAEKVETAKAIEAIKAVEAVMADETVLVAETVTTARAKKAVEALRALEAAMAAHTTKVTDAATAAGADIVGKRKIAVLSYYEQHHSVRLLNFIDRSRFQFDSSRIISQWYFWLFWLIGAVIMGSIISQWGYSNLRNRDAMFRIWNEITQSFRKTVDKREKEDWNKILESAGEFFHEHEKKKDWEDIIGSVRELHMQKKEENWNGIVESAREFFHGLEAKAGKEKDSGSFIKRIRELLHLPRPETKKEKAMFAKPRGWRNLRWTLDKLLELDPGWQGEHDRLLVELQRARDSGSNEPSWSMLHLPLLRQSMVASQAITYYDYLTKEYWRFAEFAINCPAAVCIFCLALGLYFFSLSIMYASQAWILGSMLVGVGLVVCLIAYFWWNPNVAFTSFHLYVQARSGLITGLSLFPANNPDVTNPMIQKMYTDCPDFRKWYCKSYRDKLGFETQDKCDDPTCSRTTIAPPPVTPPTTPAVGAHDPKAPSQPQAQVSVQVGVAPQVSVSVQILGGMDKKTA
jgi:hypothetical protein